MLSTPFQSQYFCPPAKAAAFAFLATVVVGLVGFGFVITAQELLVNPLASQGPNLSQNADVSFTTELISADSITRTLVMDWSLQPANCTRYFVADIYMDPGFLDSASVFLTSSRAPFADLSPYQPIYRFNTSGYCNGMGGQPVFRTVSRLLAVPEEGTELSSIQSYPFDKYSARFSVYALDYGTQKFIPLNRTRSFGVAVNFDVTIETDIPQGPQLYLVLKVKRSQAIQTFVILTALTNCTVQNGFRLTYSANPSLRSAQGLIAIGFLMVSVATLIYTPHEIYREMFIVPIGALFAFTSVRANFPGAPVGFGAEIDLYSTLPVLVILGLCGFFLLLRVLYGRIRKHTRNMSDMIDQSGLCRQCQTAQTPDANRSAASSQSHEPQA